MKTKQKTECNPIKHDFVVSYIETYGDQEVRNIHLHCTKCGKEKINGVYGD